MVEDQEAVARQSLAVWRVVQDGDKDLYFFSWERACMTMAVCCLLTTNKGSKKKKQR